MKRVFDRSAKGAYIGDPTGPFYFMMLQQLFTQGVREFAADTHRRAAFVEENEHLIACSYLVLLFAFLESSLGGKSNDDTTWITRHGGRAVEELECLRIVRNAFVHTNSIVTDLESTGAHDVEKLRRFISKMEAGQVADDKGNIYPQYMSMSSNGNVTLNNHAILTFTALGRTLSH